MLDVSLGSSWPKDPPSCEASGFPEPVGPEIPKNRKNVFTSTSSVQKIQSNKKLSGIRIKVSFQNFLTEYRVIYFLHPYELNTVQ